MKVTQSRNKREGMYKGKQPTLRINVWVDGELKHKLRVFARPKHYREPQWLRED